MRFGVRIENAWTTAQQLRYALTAERLGFDTIWVEGNPFKREPFSTLGTLARETTRAQLGVAVASVYFMHPLIMASLAVTVDELSGGRMRLGVGCSSTHALGPLGLRQRKPVAHVREAVALIRALLAAEGPVQYEGEIFRAHGVALTGSTGRPIPIFAAAEGPRMQTMVGEVADGLIFPVANAEYNRRALENVGAGLERAGRRRDDFQIVAYARFWTVDDPDRDTSLLRPLGARLLYRVSPAARAQMGLGEEMAARYVSDPESIPEALLRELITVGDGPAVRAGVGALAALGFEELVLDFPAVPGVTADQQYEKCYALMCAFAEAVLARRAEVEEAIHAERAA